MRCQCTYYLFKWPAVFYPIVEPHLKEGESYESFVLYMYQGLSFPVMDVTCAIVPKMWNLSVTIVSPKGVEKKFCKMLDKEVNIVIAWNGVTGVNCQFSATKVDNVVWRPQKPTDWSTPVKRVSNVKTAATNDKKYFRKRSAQKKKGNTFKFQMLLLC